MNLPPVRSSGASVTAAGGRFSFLQRHYLAWSHDVEGIQRALDRPHQIDGLAMLRDEGLELVHAYAMLAGAGPAHPDRAHADALGEIFRLRALDGIGRVEHHAGVEISVTHVTDDRRGQARRID